MTKEELKTYMEASLGFFHYDEVYKLYQLMIDDFTIYLTPSKLEEYNYAELSQHVAQAIILEMSTGKYNSDISLN